MNSRIWFKIDGSEPDYIRDLVMHITAPQLGQSVYKAVTLSKDLIVVFYFNPTKHIAVAWAQLPHPMLQLDLT